MQDSSINYGCMGLYMQLSFIIQHQNAIHVIYFFGCFYCFYVVTVNFCNSLLLIMYMYTFFLHRAVQLHQKLSSPLRKRSLAESIKISTEKQNKAQQFRDKLNEERVQRSRVISDKVCISI